MADDYAEIQTNLNSFVRGMATVQFITGERDIRNRLGSVSGELILTELIAILKYIRQLPQIKQLKRSGFRKLRSLAVLVTDICS